MSLDLDAIKARVEGATPGPWVVETPESVYGHDGGEDWRDLRWVSDEATVADDDPPWLGPMLTADAEFIAHAREDVPALITEVERLQAALQEARAGWYQNRDKADLCEWALERIARVRALVDERTSTGERWVMVSTDDVLEALDGES